MRRDFLLDTNVVSVSAPDKADAPQIGDWLDRESDRLYMSAVTLAEVSLGAAKAAREHPGRRAFRLESWVAALPRLFGGRILEVDHEIALLAGRIADRAIGAGHAPDLADSLIGATALHHGLTVLTRNVRHFRHLGVDLIDPFQHLPTD